MTCPNCGTALMDEDLFCPNCGTNVPASAPTQTTAIQKQSKQKRSHKKLRLLIIILVALIVIGLCAYGIYSYYSMRGTCGNGLTWEYDGRGTLTISGYGQMENYDYVYYDSQHPSHTPGWGDYRNEISLIVIEDGATSIGNQAFRGCNNLKEIIIPDTVKRIGNGAFTGCESLEEISIPNGIEEIEKETFKECTNLADVSIPQSVTTIEASAFYHCSALTSLDLPDSIDSIGGKAFESTALTCITIPASVTELGQRTFADCQQLSKIVFKGNPPTVNEDPVFYHDGSVFYGVTATVFYPAGFNAWGNCPVRYFGENLVWHPIN
ncbi:MAG: zinc-ribbon domain-containing protein [Ruminococcaceae bacterium]|nr:zinc-ribbon domain-containing protein [Oscillospiraceae bacterium]